MRGMDAAVVTLSRRRVARIESAVREAVPDARFGREMVSWTSVGGEARALRRLEAYVPGGVLVAMPVTVTVDAGDGRQSRYDGVRIEARPRAGDFRRWDASTDMIGTVVGPAVRYLASCRGHAAGTGRPR